MDTTKSNLAFHIESDKKTNFEINILVKENHLQITAIALPKTTKLIFEATVSISEIQINKYFYYYEDMSEVYNELESQFKLGKIVEETSELLYIVPLLNKKIPKIIFTLKDKEKSDNLKIDEIYNIKKEISLLNERINNLEKQNKFLLEEINKYKNIKIKENDIKKEELENSLIVKENEIDLIKKFIGKEPKFKLLFRASVDGDTKEKFEQKCLNKQPTLALIKNHLGNRFGGYTTQNWNHDNNDYNKKDPFSFIFSLDKRTKYNLKDKNNRAIHTKSYIIYFGNADFCFLGNNFLTEKKGWCNKGTRYFEANSDDLSDDEYFVVQEFELYQVLF